jgi:hypothetical protein
MRVSGLRASRIFLVPPHLNSRRLRRTERIGETCVTLTPILSPPSRVSARVGCHSGFWSGHIQLADRTPWLSVCVNWVTGDTSCCTKPLARQVPSSEAQSGFETSSTARRAHQSRRTWGGLDRFETMETDPQRIQDSVSRFRSPYLTLARTRSPEPATVVAGSLGRARAGKSLIRFPGVLRSAIKEQRSIHRPTTQAY